MRQLVSETTASGTAAEATTSYTYDPATMGLATITDPLGHVTTQTFDDRGNVLTRTDPTGREVTSTYDAWDHRPHRPCRRAARPSGPTPAAAP